ncbi:MAG: flagellar type III secretion system protein FlhB [Gammaproteobacteria bacterium]|nr:flagellar type III secretion system protein FlhB [Gammaproteobacteria bacterium]MBU1776180.1 flagellar type III secretion system protein FlhB [Gammaproteobacteria bacterium]MBU1968228.1 flagellar type III secretion system protein FlhB [Gammaproteobacteria bacterium]
MAEDSDLEKTEAPTGRRIEKARQDGQVARSRELSTFAVLMAGGAGLWMMGSMLSQSLINLIREGLTLDSHLAFHTELLLPRLHELAMATLISFLPLLGLLLLVALFSPLLMDGWLFSVKPLQPNFGKLDPIKGISRLFSTHSLMELAKAFGKALVVGGIGAWVVWSNRDAVLMLVSEPVYLAIPHLGSLVWGTFAAIMGGMLLIVAVDVPFQLWEHHKKLKMTKEEVRQEAKETEGDPQIKARVRSMQREMARRRMMSEIPTADVVVTNPTHYSVALKYSENKMRAPVVVAKGSHLLAAKIKEIAKENNVPILEAPPLARALHRHCELGDAIPEALYTAVAEVLAYVYQLRRYKTVGGAYPQEPAELPVPKELDPANAA